MSARKKKASSPQALLSKFVKVVQKGGHQLAKRGRRTEAAILFHIASRFPALLSGPPETPERLQKEIKELMSYFPPTKRFTNVTTTERKAMEVSYILAQGFDEETKTFLTKLATQAPGRPGKARQYAIIARDQHDRGRTWREIEDDLLGHQLNPKKPGQTIRREVQLLNASLKRYDVKIS